MSSYGVLPLKKSATLLSLEMVLEVAMPARECLPGFATLPGDANPPGKEWMRQGGLGFGDSSIGAVP